MRENIADEGRDDADGRLPAEAVRAAIHLEEEGYGNRRADNPANRSEAYVLHTECSENVAACITRKQASHAPANFSSAGRARPPVLSSNASRTLNLRLGIVGPSLLRCFYVYPFKEGGE